MAGKSDYAKLRERFVARQKALEAGADERWWKPDLTSAGQAPVKYKIRILPPFDGHNFWYLEYGVHYRVKNEEGNFIPITCPQKTLKNPCPICEFTKGLWRGGDADKAIAREIGSKTRFASNVLILNHSANDVKIWSYGTKIWSPLSELCVGSGEDDFVPIDDPKQGFNMNLSIAMKQTDAGNFPDYTVTPEMKATALSDPSAVDRLHNLAEIIHGQVKAYDEIRAILLGSDSGATPESAPVSKKGAASTATASAPRQKAAPPPASDSGDEEVIEPVTGNEETSDGTSEENEGTGEDNASARKTPEELVKLARAAMQKRAGSK